MKPMSKNTASATKLPTESIPEQRVTLSLDSKLDAINRHEEIIWKVRAGYLGILYAGLAVLAKPLALLQPVTTGPTNIPANSLRVIFFLILGFSLSAFLVDFAYLRKKLRIIVVRDMLIDAAYNPSCQGLKNKDLPLLLHVGSERPLANHFPLGQEKYKLKRNWNVIWILLPIYATTPLLASILGVLYLLRSQ